MKTIGILFGRERTFPEAFCHEVNARDAGCRAEPCRVEPPRFDRPAPYDVIVDRISHDVPFYQDWLKQAALFGTRVINNPYWRIADDKYLGTCLAARLGIAVPKTYILPSKRYIKDVTPESLTNMAFVNWESVAADVGLPCYLKPAHGGGWKSVSRCDTLEDLIHNYDQSDQLVMMLQEGIQWSAYARLLCIGQEHIAIAPWDPTQPHHLRYTQANFSYGPELEARMVEQARILNRALGYDMNTVEFAVRDGVPYAIDFTNTAPDFDRNSLTEHHFDWVVKTMATLAIARAHQEPIRGPKRWDELL